MTGYSDYLRWLYRDGRPNLFARVHNRVSAVAFSAGIWPGGWRRLRFVADAADA